MVDLEPWLSHSTRVRWNDPGESEAVETFKGCFQAPMLEWKAAVRNMVRSALLRVNGPNDGVPHLRAGAFAVRKDKDKDRLIADIRLRNAKEDLAGPVRMTSLNAKLRRRC